MSCDGSTSQCCVSLTSGVRGSLEDLPIRLIDEALVEVRCVRRIISEAG
jgi:hypothetical protein